MTGAASSRDPTIGSVDLSGERAVLSFRRRVRHPPAEVWRALTDPRELIHWFLTEATLDAREGGQVVFDAGPSRFRVTGRILRWDPPRVFEHEWIVAPRPELPAGENAIIRWELAPEGDGTLVSLTFRGLSKKTAVGFAPGTHGFLDRLEAQLDGRPLPDWVARVGELRPSYPKWDDASR